VIDFRVTAVFFIAWAVISMLGAVANLDPTQDDAFTEVTDSAYSGEVVTLDNPPLGGGQEGISALFSLPKAAGDWIGAIARAATFQSPIWDGGWSNIVRVFLATIGGAYLLVLVVKGLEIVASLVPG
jgi:hypothetical protein